MLIVARNQAFSLLLFQVVLFNPGETDLEGYEIFLTNQTLTGFFAQEIGGANIVLERKKWSPCFKIA